MSAYQDLPWPDDEHAGSYTQHNTSKAYFRTWKDMPLRNEWNAAPFRKGCAACNRCGYKWQQTDFEYRDGSMTNGQPNPVCLHATCWNCWMADTNHAQVRDYWSARDRQYAPPQAAKGTRTGLNPVGAV